MSWTQLEPPCPMLELGLYLPMLKNLQAIGFPCDQVGLVLSEELFVETEAVLERLWRALGLPPSTVPANPVSHVPHAPYTRGRNRSHMLSETRALLRAFYLPQQLELASRLPALDFHRWWDNETLQASLLFYHHGGRRRARGKKGAHRRAAGFPAAATRQRPASR